MALLEVLNKDSGIKDQELKEMEKSPHVSMLHLCNLLILIMK
jgi:hypothetical protein